MQDDIFIDLVEAVENQGGELLAETHYPTPFVFKIPGNHGRFKRVDFGGTGCNQETLFNVPYERYPVKDVAEMDTIKVCAIDDRMDLWPRFQTAA